MTDKPKTHPKLESATLLFSQEKDCCDDRAFDQEIEIQSHDGGGGKFFTLKTDRWAFESVEELEALIKDAIGRINQ